MPRPVPSSADGTVDADAIRAAADPAARPAGGHGQCVLVAAQSGRALATAARRAGFVPLVADLFADSDTRALCSAAIAVEGALATGFRRDGLVAALDRLAADAPSPPIGLVLGSGFEDRPRLIERLAARYGLLGTPGPGVRAAKDPHGLAAACRQEGIPHPPIARAVPEAGEWLVKRIGGSGGAHVRRARRSGALPPGHYAQAFVPGRSVSLGFLSDGVDIRPIGFAEQWSAPTPARPWRFGGMAGPIRLAGTVEAGMIAAARRLARRFGLRGLASLDAVLDGEDWSLVEINPRPGASLDVLDCGEVPLLAAHIAACRGYLPERKVVSTMVRGIGIVYATKPIAAVLAAAWPAWVFDRPEPGGSIGAGDPIATVTAEAPDLARVLTEIERRAAWLRRECGTT
ncbi:ATP-grasp domain-containing protein [Hyphomicrobiaceae bacterium 22]|uniref:ATP-grasp domain-containing protein n=1 Tax=Prosthecodimorpha staleyi TaxID=2840188 RepID=A0A947D709_9HYPH|nr:ATP-grasp domain-containing protein [Prosthecodimorpha staleyi]